jgi:Leucine-rich repeat (LRR) protein
LAQLRVLSLQNTQLNAFPDVICSLGSLRCLYIQKNKINALPPDIVKLEYLTDFNLSCNSLTVFPELVFMLLNLKYLDISNNNIGGEISMDITNLSYLQLINISYTKLNNLSSPIMKRMSNLIVVSTNDEMRRKDLYSPLTFGISQDEALTALSFIKGRANASIKKKEEENRISKSSAK